MTEFSYQQLYSFLQTAKAGSLTKAAGRLSVSQPALSLQLRQLEKSLGEKLYRRTRRGIELTTEGRLAALHGEKIFAEGEALLASLKKQRRPVVPLLRLGVSRDLPGELGRRILAAARDQGAAVSFLAAPPAELRQKLRTGELDLAASEDALSGAGKARKAGEAVFFFFATPVLAKALGRFLAEATILAPLLLPAAESPVRRQLDRGLARSAGRWQVRAQTGDFETLRWLAVHGQGAACLPQALAFRDVSEGRLVRLGAASPPACVLPVWLVRSPRSPEPGVGAVLDRLMNQFHLGEP